MAEHLISLCKRQVRGALHWAAGGPHAGCCAPRTTWGRQPRAPAAAATNQSALHSPAGPCAPAELQEDNPEEEAALDSAAGAVDKQLDEGYRALGQGQGQGRA